MEKPKVIVNVGNRHEAAVRDLVENGDPKDIAAFLRSVFDKAEPPPIRPEGFETIKVNLSDEGK